MAYKKVMKRVPTQSVGASAANTPPPARPPPAFQDCEVVEWTAAYAEEKMQASKVRLERHERESKIAMEDEAQRAQERAAAEKAAAAKRAKEIAEMNSPSKEACEKCGKVDRGPGKRCNCYCDRCDNSMRSCDCSCFTGSCTVALEDGSIRRIDSLQAGDMVFSGQFMEDAGVSRPLYKAFRRLWTFTPSTDCSVVQLLPGCLVTTSHPISVDQGRTWVRPDEKGMPQSMALEHVFTMELDGRGAQDSNNHIAIK